MEKATPVTSVLNVKGLSPSARSWWSKQYRMSEDKWSGDHVTVHNRIIDDVPIPTYSINLSRCQPSHA